MLIENFKEVIQQKLFVLNPDFKQIECPEKNGENHKLIMKKGICSCPLCNINGERASDIFPIAEIVKLFPDILPDFQNFLVEYNKAKAVFFEINSSAYQYFKENLISGSEAHIYAKNRKLFGVGYAPDNGLYNYLKNKGFSKEDILNSGLCVKKQNGGVYDYFRDRIMFPIYNDNKDIIAFAGRKVNFVKGEDTCKYLNSKNSDFFRKSQNLYGLHFLKKDIHVENIFICEGYVDVHAMVRNGYPAVCTMGVALSETQYKKAKSIADNVILMYDGDRAGQEAINKTLEQFKGLKSVRLPENLDPDEFFIKYDKKEFEKILDSFVKKTF